MFLFEDENISHGLESFVRKARSGASSACPGHWRTSAMLHQRKVRALRSVLKIVG